MEYSIDAFLGQAEQNPDSIVVLDCHSTYSYGEANHRSAFLSGLIIKAQGLNQMLGRIELLLPITEESMANP